MASMALMQLKVTADGPWLDYLVDLRGGTLTQL